MRNLLDHSDLAFALALALVTLGLAIDAWPAAAHEDELLADAGEPDDKELDGDLDVEEPGDWIVLPETAAHPREGRVATGSCQTAFGPNVVVRLGAHGHDNPLLPDDAYGELAGRWEPFATQLEVHSFQVRFEVACGTSSNADVEFFTSSWLPLDRTHTRQEFPCPDTKPFLMGARCQTLTSPF
ncbi:MAG TPA: hypothetical protein VJR89_07560 [Polyangiales bacterium]|nr:hypothetical protein [Polyangiales bacterium]